MKLKLVNNFNKKEYEFEGFDVKDSRNFYHFSIKLKEGMQDGEYTYILFDDEEKVLATSLLQIGDFIPENKVYKNENNSYTVYD